MKLLTPVRLAALLAAAVLFASFSVFANPRPLPFTYQHEQLATGESEVEQFVNLTPTKAQDVSSGKAVWYGLTEFITEFETGITDRLELGLYVTLVPTPTANLVNAPPALESNGMKQRLRWALAPSGLWPLDVSLYGELSENEHEFELEGKLLLQRRFGIARIMANLSSEQEFYYRSNQRDLVLNPSAGVTFEPIPNCSPDSKPGCRVNSRRTADRRHAPSSSGRTFTWGRRCSGKSAVFGGRTAFTSAPRIAITRSNRKRASATCGCAASSASGSERAFLAFTATNRAARLTR